MLKDKIGKYFHQFPDLRVLFFFDESKSYEEEVKQLGLEDIRIVRWANNDFFLKTMLHGEWVEEKIFLYFPKPAPRIKEAYHEFPLMGLLVANKELSLDDVGAFMDEYQLHRHQKSLVAKYMKELQYGGVQEVCKPVLNATCIGGKSIDTGAGVGFSPL